MKKILIATHGKMASGMKSTIELLIGNMADITTIDAYIDLEADIIAEIREFFNQKKKGEQVFVFTDLQGGSVNQKLISYSKDPEVVLITGVNLAILLSVIMAEDEITSEEIAGYIKEAREQLKAICLASEKSAKKTDAAANEKKEIKPKAEEQNKPVLSGEKAVGKIAALRVDDRLIHGQVAMTWTKQLKIRGILVANDEAANDETQKMALKMAAPGGVKVLVRSVKDAIRVLNHPKVDRMRILVLTRSIKDAVTVCENTREFEFLNVGNTGRFDGIDVAKKTVLTPTIMLTDQEITSLKQLVEINPDTCMQQVPNDERKLVKDVIEKEGL
ncbi:MAG: PTS sugar transporter subunit IIB [Lachnospiraceae bacterium]|nr:PTS sugar transporter subunit IIB [Lachnospiraceae bacterium]